MGACHRTVTAPSRANPAWPGHKRGRMYDSVHGARGVLQHEHRNTIVQSDSLVRAVLHDPRAQYQRANMPHLGTHLEPSWPVRLQYEYQRPQIQYVLLLHVSRSRYVRHGLPVWQLPARLQAGCWRVILCFLNFFLTVAGKSTVQ